MKEGKENPSSILRMAKWKFVHEVLGENGVSGVHYLEKRGNFPGLALI
jgi:hypothetical protein